MDRLTQEQRSENMSHVKGRETKIEQRVRSWLFSHGYRFRKNDSRLPGKPDIVLPKYKTVVFINGCFWHQHQGCRKATLPETRRDFWEAKLNRNVERDQANITKLISIGWNVVTIWECELKKACFEDTMLRLQQQLIQQVGE